MILLTRGVLKMHCLSCDSVHAKCPFFTPHKWCFGYWHTGAPLVDVVFVHGIRGGAFATWRREGVQNLQPGHKAGNLDHLYCWPSTWLPQDVPQARLLSMEYAAPASGWEVSHSLLHSLPHCYQCIPSPPSETCLSCPLQTIAARSRYAYNAFCFVAAYKPICIQRCTLYPVAAILQSF